MWVAERVIARDRAHGATADARRVVRPARQEGGRAGRPDHRHREAYAENVPRFRRSVSGACFKSTTQLARRRYCKRREGVARAAIASWLASIGSSATVCHYPLREQRGGRPVRGVPDMGRFRGSGRLPPYVRRGVPLRAFHSAAGPIFSRAGAASGEAEAAALDRKHAAVAASLPSPLPAPRSVLPRGRSEAQLRRDRG
jgi:hypothetical protein